MLPGPDIIYKCPHCGDFLKRGSLVSGNTFGAKLYSDGKQIAPMLPDFPNLTKCKKCNNIFWLNDLERIGEYEYREKDGAKKSLWEAAATVAFLDISDLYIALGMLKDPTREKTIRIWIWWAFNDRIRECEGELFVEKNDQELWEENCRILINLLDDTDLNEKLMIADLYRNLDEFYTCIEIIDSIDNEEINWVKDPMKYLAKKEFSSVFLLQSYNTAKTKNKLPFFQMRGELKEKQGDYQGALEDYDKAIFLDDSIPTFFILKAGVYEILGNSDMALSNFDKALSLDSNCASAYINRSLFFRRRNKLKEAKKDYEKAISLEPRSFEIITFSEIDLFKYGKFKSIINAEQAKLFNMSANKGALFVDVNFGVNKKAESDSSLFFNGKNLPYFVFRKKRLKPIMNKWFVKFEFALAKCVCYTRVYLLRKPIKYIDNAIIN